MNNKLIYQLLSISIMLYTANALAADSKKISGAICQPTGSRYDQLSVKLGNGTMTNLSDKSQTWICPLIRDRMSAKTKSSHFAVYAMMASENHADRVSCTAYSRTEANKLYSTSYLGSRLNAGNNSWILKSSFGGLSAPANGPMYMRCFVPGKKWRNGKWFYSGISNVYYNEL